MNSAPDNSDAIRKVLRVKRYERPHPRYFNHFSSHVMARIQKGEARVSWWERFGFDLRPALGAATGVMACALIIYGVATAGGDESSPVVGAINAYTGMAQSSPAAVQSGDVLVVPDSTSANSTNPVAYGTPNDRSFVRPNILPASFQR